ncbi:MAG TPA: hypothetical protein PJ991_04525 [Kiritimatiellia bacterium]|nr:hypothetical protein [Kiritimatiellia bacterium]
MAVKNSRTDSKSAIEMTGSIFLICGTDEFEVSRNAREIVARLCPPENQTLGMEVVDGACDTIEEAVLAMRKCLDALCTVGFFGSAKLVWLRDASFFNEGKPGKFEDVKKAVAELTDEIKRGFMPGVQLVVSAAQVDKRTAFYKAVEKSGKVLRHDFPEKDYQWDAHAGDALRDMLEAAGLKARHDVIQLIIERAGNQTRQLASEVEKLSIYLKDRKDVRIDDVLEIVSPARERGYGELANAFCEKDLAGTLKIFRQMMHQKEQPVGLMISLENRIRELLLYRTAMDRKWLRVFGSDDWPKVEWTSSPEAETFFSSLEKDPRKANPFWAGKLAGRAARFTTHELQRVYRLLVDEHGRMTDGSAPAEFLLEWAIIKSLGVKQHA